MQFFYLATGSLVVTTATGRGFPTIDVICLNEQANTIPRILGYFNVKNSRWKQIQSIVIDKGVTE
ncbi:hypothetical protein P3T76_015522 [Phytophthora citrophthora]|uniref:ZSWIM1/3 RNaseH-like domain-containing protein n=1 Tax=Phytophthora citrophthora TaxID=4793 RepID=A0AAD9LA89_9STRA|nr:hypothetical protein P3T76_015968 [Phytophthora citrophthora]KAK1928988.1 hypothetical protein P3T76_015522 [Phytophthora citrophthora]